MSASVRLCDFFFFRYATSFGTITQRSHFVIGCWFGLQEKVFVVGWLVG